MNTLTEKERSGLEDVFNSIHVDKTKYSISNYLSSFLLIDKSSFKPRMFTFKLKKGIKLTKISRLFSDYVEKKKNLSK